MCSLNHVKLWITVLDTDKRKHVYFIFLVKTYLIDETLSSASICYNGYVSKLSDFSPNILNSYYNERTNLFFTWNALLQLQIVTIGSY